MTLIIIKVRGVLAIARSCVHTKELVGLRRRGEVGEVHVGFRLLMLRQGGLMQRLREELLLPV